MLRGSPHHWLLVTSVRLDGVGVLLKSAGIPSEAISTLADPMELFQQPAREDGLVLLDADDIPTVDLGIVARWSQRHPGYSIFWVASDPRASGRRLRDDAAPVDGILAWPQGATGLRALLQALLQANIQGQVSPFPSERTMRQAHPISGTGSGPGAPGDELSAIEAILAESITSAEGPAPPPWGRTHARAQQTGGSPRGNRADDHAAEGNGSAQRRADSFYGSPGGPERQGSKNEERAPTAGGPKLEGPGRAWGILSQRNRKGQAPRTALLRSTIAPRLPKAETEPVVEREGRHIPSPVGRGAVADQPLYDPREPLLSAEELDAFFDPPSGQPLDPSIGSGEWDPSAGTETEAPSLESERSPAGFAAHETPAMDRPATEVSDDPPAWMKDQVADLADLVQALDLRARSNHAHLSMEGELARLRQFTRTLGLVASPPAHGDQSFDLGIYVEEQLGALAGATPDSPRLLFRKRGSDFDVRAEKSLVAAALDALLQTSIHCAGAGEVIRVSVHSKDDRLTVRIEFPKGPLGPLAPKEILRPYGLKEVLPNIGPNALSAAGAIAVGQGGDVVLEEVSDSKLAFELHLVRSGSRRTLN